jgi:hypothetical protein
VAEGCRRVATLGMSSMSVKLISRGLYYSYKGDRGPDFILSTDGLVLCFF